MKEVIIGSLAAVFIGFLLGTLLLGGIAEYNCEKRGYAEWNIKGCYNDVEKYEHNSISK
jgi:hypothetical protein|tara:strand:- start:2150 stop:2326 length:177 start_codon:yes stop_codon:yes gene_type:complete